MGAVKEFQLKTGHHHTDKALCIEQFWLVEAITILKNERAGRIDYHTTIDHWQDLARQAGKQVTGVRHTWRIPERPVLFTMALQPAI